MKKVILFLCLIMLCVPVSAKDAIQVQHKKSGVYVFKINTKKLDGKIKPLVVDELTTAKEIFENCDYQFVLNGGFFDMKTGGEISYVIIDGVEVQSPCNNQKLVNDLTASCRLEAVLNRAELRILENKKGKTKYEIAKHNDLPKKGYKIKHSIQAGPQIAPKMDLVGESFVKYNDEGKVIQDTISATKRRERTLLAVKGKYIYAITFDRYDRKTMAELSYYCKKKRFKHALALDGGGSTSVFFKDIAVVCENKEGRKVKSFLVIEK